MHEAGLLAVAVAEALAAGGPGGQAGSGDPGAPPAAVTGSEAAAAAPLRPVAIEIRVHDPIHVAPESARLHAELALRARGFTDVLIEVTADPVDCVLCGVANEARAEHPFCAECGWPLPDRGGHAVEAVVRWGAA